MRRRVFGIAAIGLLALALPASAGAGTITPTTTQDVVGAGAPCSLREAVDLANLDTPSPTNGCTDSNNATADVIQLAGGDYELTVPGLDSGNASGDLDIGGPLTIKGIGAGLSGIDGNTATTGDRVIEFFNPGTFTLSGLTLHDGASTTSGGVIQSSNAGATLSLSSAAVKGGQAPLGGGIYAANGAVTLTNSQVSGNTASGVTGGGGILAPTVTLTNSTVSGNTASGASGGGGVRAVTDATLTKSTVRNNSASTGNGGGVQAGANISLTDSTVEDNDAGQAGGGVSSGGTLTATRSKFNGNSASDIGGGVHAAAGATVTSSTISDNSSGAAGGGIITGGTTLNDSTVSDNFAGTNGGGLSGGALLSRSSVLRNRAVGKGGGIETSSGSLSVFQSTIAANDAGTEGGGVYLEVGGSFANSTLSGNAANGDGGGISFATLTQGDLQNVTITNNSAGGNGGGVRVLLFISVRNTVVAANRGTGPDCFTSGAVVSYDHNLIGTNTGCSTIDQTNAGDDQIGNPGPIDPLLGPLAANGGPTLTHRPLSGSPAINMGNPSTPGIGGGACEAVDQRGVPRSLGGRCDIGAYEVARPNARISSTSISHRRHRATFRFSSKVPFATFRCRVDNKSYASCRSSKTYKHLKPGKHKFSVEAKDVDGASVAVKTFRI